MTDAKRITPLTEYEARELIQRCYRHGRKVAYAPNGVEQKLFGTVVGTGEKLVHRGGLDHKIAGRYLDFTKYRIAPAGGGTEVLRSINNGSVSPMSPYSGADATWMTEEEMRGMARILIRIGPLPETPFWEGDTVEVRDYIAKGGKEGCSNRWLVRGIDYDYLGRGEIFSEGICKWQDGRIKTDESCTFPIGVFSLVERGNLWKMEHGEPLDFTDIEEEAKFHQSLGMSEKLKLDLDGLEALFDFQCGIRAIRENHAHQMKLKNKTTMSFVLIKYQDQEFARRMREHTLKRYDS